MKKLLSTTAAIVLVAGTAWAVTPELGVELGRSMNDIGAALAADGYEMTKYEAEEGRIEVTAIKDGGRYEMYIDPATGKVIKLESQLRAGPAPLPGIGDDAIRAKLAADGYQITKYEREGGEIEVYAMKNGTRYELKLDPRSGAVLRSEVEN